MVFGRSKKRESWSSRPLSMILPDNVKLFSSSKKSRSILERASHEQSGRLVEGYKPRPGSIRSIMPNQEATAPTTSDIETQSRKSRSSQVIPANLNDADSSVLSGSTEASTSQLSIPEMGSDIMNNKHEEPPFLTLNLDDSKTSLQELTDRLGDLNVNDSPFAPVPNKSSTSMPDSMMFMPATNNRDITASNSSTTLLNSPITGSAADPSTPYTQANTQSTTEPTTGPPRETSDQTADYINRFPWARDDIIEPTSPALEPSNRQDSINSQGSAETHDSVDTQGTQSSFREPNEYMLNPNVKVLVNRGVYIFDPSDNQDCLRTLKLSDDESFNPFEYE